MGKTNNITVLEGCEIGCLTGDLIACPLSKEEQGTCARRKKYLQEKKEKKGLYCHQCGNLGIVHESLAEGYWCPNCGSSDQDE